MIECFALYLILRIKPLFTRGFHSTCVRCTCCSVSFNARACIRSFDYQNTQFVLVWVLSYYRVFQHRRSSPLRSCPPPLSHPPSYLSPFSPSFADFCSVVLLSTVCKNYIFLSVSCQLYFSFVSILFNWFCPPIMFAAYCFNSGQNGNVVDGIRSRNRNEFNTRKKWKKN